MVEKGQTFGQGPPPPLPKGKQFLEGGVPY